MLTPPEMLPVEVGLKVTLNVQVAAIPRVWPLQLDASSAKSVDPVRLSVPTCSADVPLFCRVKLNGPPDPPTGAPPKSCEPGVTLMLGWTPIPLTLTLCG